MSENKNKDEILENEDSELESSILEESAITEDIDSSDDIDSAESIDEDTVKKSQLPLKIIIPMVVIIAALIVTVIILAFNKTNKNDTNTSSNTALASSTVDVAEPSFKIDGEKVDTDDLVFLKINGSEVKFDELRNCYYQFLYNYGPYYGISEDTFNNASGDELKSMFSTFKESLAEYIKGGYVHTSYAKENNITFDEADKKTAEENIQKKYSAWDRVCFSRDKKRPIGYDYINALIDQFYEFHGDRMMTDDKAVTAGIGFFNGLPVTVIAQEKNENFGMCSPQGYRKALRLMRQAEKFHRPILCFVDTPGAACGIEAEEHGQ